jgi:hypothetical protein
MSLTYTISESGNHLTVVGTGKVTSEHCIELLKVILQDPLCRPEQTALLDMRKATFPDLESAGIIALAKLIEEFSDVFKTHVAIVAKSTALLSAELLSTHVRNAKNISIRVFVDHAAALDYCREDWIGQNCHSAATAAHRDGSPYPNACLSNA